MMALGMPENLNEAKEIKPEAARNFLGVKRLKDGKIYDTTCPWSEIPEVIIVVRKGKSLRPLLLTNPRFT